MCAYTCKVRDFMDPKSDLDETLCCLDEAHSLKGRNECTDPRRAHAEGLRCMHKLHTDPSCAAPTLSAEYKLPIDHLSQKLGSDWEWIVKVRACLGMVKSLFDASPPSVNDGTCNQVVLDWGIECRDLYYYYSPNLYVPVMTKAWHQLHLS